LISEAVEAVSEFAAEDVGPSTEPPSWQTPLASLLKTPSGLVLVPDLELLLSPAEQQDLVSKASP